MPKQPDPPSPSKPVPTSWWFLTGGVGAPPRTQAAFHRLASERKAAYRARVIAKQECEEAEQALKDALAKLEAEHGPSGLVGRMLWRLRGGAGDNSQDVEEGDDGTAGGDGGGGNKSCQGRRQRLGRKELMERYGPDSGIKTGRAAMAMAESRSVSKPQANVHAGDSVDHAPVSDTAADNATADDARADGTGADGAEADDAGAAADNNAPANDGDNENTAE